MSREEYIIKKLWWENAAELARSSKNIWDDYINNRKQAIVVSAIRSPEFNTTDNLITIWKLLSKENIERKKIDFFIDKLEKFHIEIVEKNLLCSKEKIIEIIRKNFKTFRRNIDFYIWEKNKKIIPTQENDYSINILSKENLSILGFWEILSCKIFSGVIDSLSTEGVCSKSIDLSNLVAWEELKWKTEAEIFNFLSIKISDVIVDNINRGFIPVLSGYIGVFKNGIEKTIGRGYSDATAAVCTVWLAHKWKWVVLEIQKSVPWLMSADPRILDNPWDARVIEKLDYLIAREITGDCWAQAKLLHYQTLRNEVQEAWVRVHLFDPFSTESDGTWIESTINTWNGGVEFIWGRENMIFFSISSGKMFERWVLSRLFDIVKDYFPVDIVSASETEITFTIDGKCKTDEKLKEMTKKIRKEFNLHDDTSMEYIEYKKDMSLIFLVGQHMKDHIGLMAKAVTTLSENNINIKISSQGRLQRAMVFWIESKDMKRAINLLHKKFIT